MPRAKTGCNYVLYTLVSKESIEHLKTLVERAPKGVGRPLVMDAIIKRAVRQKLPRIKTPVYAPHKKVERKILKTA